MLSRPTLTVVIPVLNERETCLKEFIQKVPKSWEILVVDDGSEKVHRYASIRHQENYGYGMAIKSGVRLARADYIATMDGDGQHSLCDIHRLLDFVRYMDVDMVIGDRRLVERSPLRWIGRKALNWTASLFANRYINDLNSGMRIFKRKMALGYEPILCNGFSYTTSLTLASLADGYKVDWLPIKVAYRKFGVSKVKLVKDGFTTLRQIFWIGTALRTRNIRRWLRERR